MRLRAFLAVLIPLGIIIIDQIIKIAIKTQFLLGESYEIASWFQLRFTENRGMAFGMDFIGTGVLTVFRLCAVAFFIYVLSKEVKKRAPIGFIVCLAMIIAGAFGNIVDNAFYGLIFTESAPYYAASFGALPAHFVPMGQGYGTFLHGHVVDMFYFPLFQWPDWVPFLGGGTFFGAIFNFADAAISVGAAAMILFYYKYLSLLMNGTPKSVDTSAEKQTEE
ncbi:lipoprotein signal peptidase [Ihuprevotella massiliensis]|uniref:lipoprotein signal peptidase n=1 Tax=Ihuprevotella massiliensis TaxID=1852368 RepID=UPI00094E5E16